MEISSKYPQDVIQRFLSHVDKRPNGGCWVWRGLKKDNYPNLTITISKGEYQSIGGHVFSHIIFKGDVPKGFHVDHLCRNRNCVNPDHLEAVPPIVNFLRGESPMAKNFRKTHCPKGHEYTEDNTFIRKSGRRRCKKCEYKKNRERMAELKKRNKSLSGLKTDTVYGSMTLLELSRRSGINVGTLRYRYLTGKRGAELTAPIKNKN